MSEQTSIEWADSTFNPWLGCTKISPACDHCYAEAMMDSRLGRVQWGAGKPRVRTSAENWKKPARWNKRRFFECIGCGWRGDRPYYPEPEALGQCPACRSLGLTRSRRRVFCASLADVFDNEVDPAWRRDLLDLIRTCPNLDFLILTKRVGNVVPMLRVAAAHLREQLNGTQTERIAGVPTGHRGGDGNRLRWQGLAPEEADVRSLDRRDKGNAVRAGSGGDWQARGILAGPGDDRREAALRGRGQTGLAALQRADSARAYGQPQGWPQTEQPADEPRTCDVQRTAKSCDSNAGRTTSRREGIEAPEDSADRGAGCCDPRAASGRRTDQGSGHGVRIDPDGGVGHLLRRELEALLAWVDAWLAGSPPANVWIGITICNQTEFDRDVPKLRDVPAAVRFLSIEPMLGPIKTTLKYRVGTTDRTMDALRGSWVDENPVFRGEGCGGPPIDWVICGGESGPNARPLHPDWVRSLRDQCAGAGVAFFMKQMGGTRKPFPKIPADLLVREFPA